MKKMTIWITLLVLSALAFTALQTSASASQKGPQKTPGAKATEKYEQRASQEAAEAQKTPGAKATEKAEQRAIQGKGNPEDKGGKKQNLKGTVTAVGEGSLSLELGDGSTVSVALDENTRVKAPSLGKEASAADILVGARAMVQAVQGEDETLTARRVLVIPGKPATRHHVGVVTAYSPGASLTITAQDGQSYTYALSEGTKILPQKRAGELAVGSRVTVIFGRNVTGGEPLVRGVVVHPAQEN